MKKYFVFVLLLFFVDVASAYSVYYDIVDNSYDNSYYNSNNYYEDYNCDKISYSEWRCTKKVKRDVVYVSRQYDRSVMYDYTYFTDWNDSREEKLKQWDEGREDRSLIREERGKKWNEEREWRNNLREQRILDMEADRKWEEKRRKQIILDWIDRRERH